jgi:hypothetical protein
MILMGYFSNPASRGTGLWGLEGLLGPRRVRRRRGLIGYENGWQVGGEERPGLGQRT